MLLGIDLSFLELVCNTKGFPGKGRSLLDPLKAVWGKTQLQPVTIHSSLVKILYIPFVWCWEIVKPKQC